MLLPGRNLPWAPVPPPHAAARPVICHGPLVPRSSCCCQVQSLSWVPVRPPIAAVSIAHTSAMCHFRSPHTAGGFHFCHRVLYGPVPIAAASTATLWLHTLVLPRDCPNE
ncbi:unnamed protein product [Staurois parvus]|uniref:Uncharacterized protein n=1 Tax=Staurois parvus TaxID=386267 RepID=A0ABN9D299_9NEOB|nr:unnamed protein product [Staurois parvus]